MLAAVLWGTLSVVVCMTWAATPARAAGSAGPDGAGADLAGLVDTTIARWYLLDRDGERSDFSYGNPGDVPLVGDWDCDGVDTVGVFRPSTAALYLRNSNTPGAADLTYRFGDPGDVPLAGDFDGDGCDTVSLYRPSEQRIHIANRVGRGGDGLGAAVYSYVFGDPGDLPFVGDFDGDGIDSVGLLRSSTVYLRLTHATGTADLSMPLGRPRDRPVAGDWTGAGNDTPAVFRPADATWRFAGSADARTPVAVPPAGGRFTPVAGSFGDIRGAVRVASTAGVAAPGARVITRGPAESAAFGLSFDAGSDAGFTATVLDLLAERGVHASFGVTGRWAEAYPDLLTRIVDEGHHLINHTYSHRTMDTLTTEQRWAELDRTEAIVSQLTGATTLPWFRPPEGVYSPSVVTDAAARGYTYTVLWTADCGGWMGLDPEVVARRCLDRIGAGGIILMHVSSQSTDFAALPTVLDGLARRGLTPMPIDELLGE